MTLPSKQCPKCWADSPCIESGPRGLDIGPNGELVPPDPFAEMYRFRFECEFKGEKFEVVYECPGHGEFTFRQDGSPVFFKADTWVEGPNGEKLFRM